ncbi:hypothetical protein [Prochlorothrix hollandica]|uniref:Uncharacterized protein n=1 Tax=Prochlorothrix hollandica PCC 9006 = CALU 1027 TaxID=317619 RepID=A0A0M2Q172_PROHO|nr:hypothetical protein [Prochlorothrix hollandica]KKJ00709.1 hypothetical protein PROH_05335 [Prochlorothrix hollandica PCC 9006 = CALU 1027]
MDLTLLLTIIIIVVAIGVVWTLARSSGGKGARSGKPSTFGHSRVSPQLWRKLVKLTRDEETAHRLVRNLLLRYPDRDVDWCCDKAIYDLERDRYRR